jgi:hypothetical protein
MGNKEFFKKQNDESQLVKAGLTEKNKIESLEKKENIDESLADIQLILNIEDHETQEKAMDILIEKRLHELLKEAPVKQKQLSTISLSNETQSDFIHSETEIKRNMMVDGFKINDTEIYKILLKTISEFYKKWDKPPIKSVIFNSIVIALGKYFGNYYDEGDTNNANQQLYLAHSNQDSEEINLKELKEKRVAVCAEKASVAHNYLKFLGYDSHLVFSNNCKLGESNDNHAYICLSGKNGKFIFDPTNPVIISNLKNEVSSISAALYKISDEEFNHIIRRDKQKVSVMHFDQVYNGKEYKPKEEQIRIYG